MQILIADESHNDGLCRLSARVTMPGAMEIAYLRDPDYFAALRVQGDFSQTIVGVVEGEVVGAGSRSIRSLYVNGETLDMGYLSGLRIDPAYRRRGSLARGYRTFRGLHGDGRTKAYLTTIIEENEYARSVLVGGRAGLPFYEDYGLYLTHTILRHSRRKPHSTPGIFIKRCSRDLLPAVVRFLNDQGRRRQFFPVFSAEQFSTALFRDFRVEDWYVAFRGEGIAGVLGVWDQGAFKRHCVVSYSPFLRRGRIIINPLLRGLGYRPLPRQGDTLSLLYLLSPCIEGDDPAVFKALVDRILADHARSPCSGAVLGLHERDPLLPALKSYRSIVYKSRLFFVFWEDGRDLFLNLDRTRIPHLDVALL